jgi:hypothetical protein
MCIIHFDVTQGCRVYLLVLLETSVFFFEILERRVTVEDSKSCKSSSFILGKVQETERNVLHKPRDSFYNVTMQYIIAYILDNRKYTPPSSGVPWPFFRAQEGSLVYCVRWPLHVAALLQGRTCTASSCSV